MCYLIVPDLVNATTWRGFTRFPFSPALSSSLFPSWHEKVSEWTSPTTQNRLTWSWNGLLNFRSWHPMISFYQALLKTKVIVPPLPWDLVELWGQIRNEYAVVVVMLMRDRNGVAPRYLPCYEGRRYSVFVKSNFGTTNFAILPNCWHNKTFQ